VLARVGRLLEQKCRQSNVVARYGGDEFIILNARNRHRAGAGPGGEVAPLAGNRSHARRASHHRQFWRRQFPGPWIFRRGPDSGGGCRHVRRQARGRQPGFHSDAFGEGMVQRQLVSSYIEGFLQREQNGRGLQELVGTLRKLCGGEDREDPGQSGRRSKHCRAPAELREHNAEGHGEQCAQYAGMIARGLKLSDRQVADVTFAGRIHDVASCSSGSNPNKSGALTEDEFSAIKTHAQAGAEVARVIPEVEHIAQAIESHHEAFDGSGYPLGLKGEDIPLYGRIIAVADAYANMTAGPLFRASQDRRASDGGAGKQSGTRLTA